MFSLLDNPIAQAELAHQRQFSGQRNSLRYVIAVFYTSQIITSLVLYLAELVAALTGQNLRLTIDRQPLNYLLFVAAVIVHFSAVLQTLVLSSNAINREKRGGTWDTLLITRVDAGQVVVGKWWATVRRMWPSFLAAGALRLGLVVWLGIEVVRAASGYPNHIFPNPVEIILAGAAVLLLSVVNSGVTAAFGILASLLTQRSGRALVIAAVMRTFVLLFLSGGLWMTSDLIRQIESDDPAVWIVSASATSLLDSASQAMAYNGSLLAAGLAGGTAPRPMGDIQYVVYVVIPLALYLLLTWALLWMAQRVAVRQGAYQPTRYERLRPRKKKKTDALVVPE